jgi:hypothetical protein
MNVPDADWKDDIMERSFEAVTSEDAYRQMNEWVMTTPGITITRTSCIGISIGHWRPGTLIPEPDRWTVTVEYEETPNRGH